ncbi:MAG: ABC transporter substrate-binding protein, partial [Chloroflexi bacterium]|nr:ABC transporter substrate-binding protein [Chloroflexota bacterium]
RQAAQPTSDKAAAYFERYEEFAGGTLPPASFVSLLTYDFVYMVVAAMQQAETVTDSTKIAEALETVHYNGVAEDDIFFDERHIAVMGSDDCTVIEGVAECVHNAPDID